MQRKEVLVCYGQRGNITGGYTETHPSLIEGSQQTTEMLKCSSLQHNIGSSQVDGTWWDNRRFLSVRRSGFGFRKDVRGFCSKLVPGDVIYKMLNMLGRLEIFSHVLGQAAVQSIKYIQLYIKLAQRMLGVR
jgi:hypothetical protein